MKSKVFKRLSVLVLVLTVFSAALLCGTLAKYLTTVDLKGTGDTAAWNFTANVDGASGGSFSIKDTVKTENVAANKIAPGQSGSFVINVTSGSEVSLSYTMKLTFTEKPANLKFYYDEAKANEIASGDSYDFNKVTETGTDFDGKILLDDATKTESFTIYWDWAFGDDVDDTADAGKAMIVDVKIVGSQIAPKAPTV